MTPESPQISVVDMFIGSSPVVAGVLYLLIIISISSWAVVLYKWQQIRAARRGAEKFIDLFWETRNLTEVSKACEDLVDNPVAEVFKAGYEELVRLRNTKKGGTDVLTTELAGIANVERAMRRAASLQMTKLEKMLTFLATAASVTPFIGLFGTVWGIMNSFLGLSQSGNTTLQAVAPGISEALIATAMGLAAAIPALVAYNHFARQARVIGVEMDTFAAEFLNIAERHFLV
jgi:biopolymer transport protein TolQ